MRETDGARRLLLTGFGGQGIVLAGYILGKAAAIFDGREATLIQAYGPEARGGATSAEITISGSPILYPYVDTAEVLACMSREGFSRFARRLAPDGVLLYDDQLVPVPPDFAPGRAFGVAATRLAQEAGRRLVANIVMLGFLAAATGVVSRRALEEAVRTSVPKGTGELNLGALALGFDAWPGDAEAGG